MPAAGSSSTAWATIGASWVESLGAGSASAARITCSGLRDDLGVVALHRLLPARFISRVSGSVVLTPLWRASGSGGVGLRPPSLRPCSASHARRQARFVLDAACARRLFAARAPRGSGAAAHAGSRAIGQLRRQLVAPRLAELARPRQRPSRPPRSSIALDLGADRRVAAGRPREALAAIRLPSNATTPTDTKPASRAERQHLR